MTVLQKRKFFGGKFSILWTLILLSVILILGARVRLVDLDARTMGHIEIFTPNIELPDELSNPKPRLSLQKTITGTLWEPHPPAWYVMMYPYTKVFGTQVFTLRLTSALAGIACILALFWLANIAETRLTAFLATLMLALNGHHILWSQIARPYIWACLMGIIATALLLSLLNSSRLNYLNLFAYLSVVLLGLMTSYYFWPLFATHILWVLLKALKDDHASFSLFQYLISVFLLASPLIAVALFQSKESYLGSEHLLFYQYYFQFGFLFEPDYTASTAALFSPPFLSIISLMGLLLYVIGIANRGKSVEFRGSGNIKTPSKWILVSVTVFATLVMLAATAAFHTKDPSKTPAILLSCLFPALIFFGAHFIERRPRFIIRSAQYLNDKISLEEPYSLITLLAIIPLAVISILSFLIPFYASRQAMLFTPYLLVVIARGIVSIVNRFSQRINWALVTISVLLIVGIFSPSIAYARGRAVSPTDYQGLAREWESLIHESDLIFVQPHWVTTPVFYYLPDRQYNYVGSDYLQALENSPNARVWVLTFEDLELPAEVGEALKDHQLVDGISSLRVSADLYLPGVPSSAPTDVIALPTNVEEAVEVEPGQSLVETPSIIASPENTLSLEFITFLGTDLALESTLRDITFDSQGNIIVAGAGVFDPAGYPPSKITTFGTIDISSAFVASISPDGSQLNWVTLIGGNGNEKGAYGIDINSNNNIYVAGATHSTDFPTTPGAWDRTENNITDMKPDAFLFKLSPDGSQLIYSTYLGGSEGESARGGLAVDSQGYAYVIGGTASRDFLDENGIANPAKVNSFIGGVGDGFVTKVSQDGSSIVYSRYIGSPNDTQHDDTVLGIRVDNQGKAYIHTIVRTDGAYTTPGAYDTSFNGGDADSYYAIISADGKQLLYATYLGGSGGEYAEHNMARDGSGFAYLVGVTSSTNFPIMGGNQSSIGGAEDGFLAKFNAAGQLVHSTYVGGSDDDSAFGPAVDMNGSMYVTGFTKSSNFQTSPGAYDTSHNGDRDVFFQAYDSSGVLFYSTFLGGGNYDYGRYIAVDPAGDIVIVGETKSSDFPVTPGAYDTTFSGVSDIFIAKFSVGGTPPPVQGALKFNSADYYTYENAGSVMVTVNRVGGVSGAISVAYATSDGTATSNLDYTPVSGTLNFANGKSTKSFSIAITDDSLFETNETIIVNLSNPTGGAVLGIPDQATVHILDDEGLAFSSFLFLPVLLQ